MLEGFVINQFTFTMDTLWDKSGLLTAITDNIHFLLKVRGWIFLFSLFSTI